MRHHHPRPQEKARTAIDDAGGLFRPHVQCREQPSLSVSARCLLGLGVSPMGPGGAGPAALYRVASAARHEAQQPADGCDNEQDDAYPQQPVEGLGEATHNKKNNCYYTSNDQKRIHGQHVPFKGIFDDRRGFPTMHSYLLRFSYAGTWRRSTASKCLFMYHVPAFALRRSSPVVNSNTLHCTTKHPYERLMEVVI